MGAGEEQASLPAATRSRTAAVVLRWRDGDRDPPDLARGNHVTSALTLWCAGLPDDESARDRLMDQYPDARAALDHPVSG